MSEMARWFLSQSARLAVEDKGGVRYRVIAGVCRQVGARLIAGVYWS